MKKIKQFLFKLIIIYVISYFFLSEISPTFAAIYDSSSGQHVANYAVEFINKYKGDSKYEATDNARFASGTFGSGTFYSCCTSGVAFVYKMALDIDLYALGFSGKAKANLTKGMTSSPYFDEISMSNVQPGDILIQTQGGHSHCEMYIGNNQDANFGSGNKENMCINSNSYTTWKAFRVKNVDVTLNGNPADIAYSYDSQNKSIYGENGFIYQGTPDSIGYGRSVSLKEYVLQSWKEIIDYFIGVITYLNRIIVVGFTAIVENLVDKTFDYVSGDTPENTTETSSGTSTESSTQKLKETADAVSKNVENTDDSQTITIEKIVYNQIPFLDVNFFNLNEAGGKEIKQGSTIYTIRENIATWYYVFRTIGMAVMLVILLYLGIKLAFTSVAQEKAIYKQMLSGWVVGFILLFTIHYIMILVLQINQAILNVLIPISLSEEAGSLYETVKTMAYSLKATTGWAGAAMFIVLVYYTIRFIYTYIKRLFHIFLLTIMSPLVAISYAVEKINKNGGSKGGIYANWLKDYILTVSMQTIHALIYTIFIATIIKLTQNSVFGIVLGFIFLNFMLKAEKIFSKIFGFGSGTDFGKGIKPKIISEGFFASKAAKHYKNYAKGIIDPAKNVVTSAGTSLFNSSMRRLDPNFLRTNEYNLIKTGKDGQIGTDGGKTLTDNQRKKKIKEYEKKRNKEIKDAIKNTFNVAKNFATRAIIIPAFIVDPDFGYMALGKTISGYKNFKNNSKKFTGTSFTSLRNEFKVMGEYSSKNEQRKKLNTFLNYLDRKGITYRVYKNTIQVYDSDTQSWRRVYKYRKVTKPKLSEKKLKLRADVENKLLSLIPSEDDSKVKVLPKQYSYIIEKGDKIELLDKDGNVINAKSNIIGKGKKIVKEATTGYFKANGFLLTGDLLTISKEKDRTLKEEKAKILLFNKAATQESNLITKYNEIMNNKLNPVNGANAAVQQSINKTKVAQFNKNVSVLTGSIDQNIITKAVEDYKNDRNTNRVVVDQMNKGIATQIDFENIANRINNILEESGDNRRIDGDKFVEDMKIAIEKNRTKKEENIRKLDERLDKKIRPELVNGGNNAPHGNAPVEEVEEPSLFPPRLGINENNKTDDQINTENIIKMIKTTTEKPEVKVVQGVSKDEIDIAIMIDEMKQTNEEAKNKTKKQIWRIDKLLNGLDENYQNSKT